MNAHYINYLHNLALKKWILTIFTAQKKNAAQFVFCLLFIVYFLFAYVFSFLLRLQQIDNSITIYFTSSVYFL